MAQEAAGAEGGQGFDQVVERLRGVVERLEQGQLGLEDALKTFEEGVQLARRGHALLDAAEKRVEILTRGPGERDAVVPFEADQSDRAERNGGG
jgi:exodeoxyribonuclease VII small subunit